ncbi:PAS domain-containing sensor histidine kinase [Azospirillum canadense]|uniref:PAS domain-containing sensor histidine kinase n=1 Tax=Azospirillum canadense TaxID=403962 RepID=UPI0022264334|nr:PAS domain S-box protein [Azospirillum canadense]MCW2238599.1 PAS domain S-box-containing protein [Azospirillum canadense]
MLWANGSACALWGAADMPSLVARDFASSLSEASRTRFALYGEAFARGETVREQWTFFPNGRPVTVDCLCSGWPFEGRTVLLVEGRVAAEAGSDDAERRSLEALRHSPEMVSLYRHDGAVLMRNPAAQLAFDAVMPDDSDRFVATFTDTAQGPALRRDLADSRESTAVIRAMTGHGERWHEVALRAVSDPATGLPAILAIQHDVTERMRLQRELQASEERLQMAVDASRHGLWDWNVQTGATYYSPRWQSMLGFEPGEVTSDIGVWEERTHPDDRETMRRVLQDHLGGRTQSFLCEYRMQAKGGSWVWILGRGRVVDRGPDGRALRMVGTHSDITERKAADAELADSKARLDAILANAPVGIFIVDDGRRVLRANEAMTDIFQWSMDAMVGAGTRIIYGDEAVYDDIGRRAYPMMRQGETFADTIPMRRADGAEVWCRIIGRQIRPDDPTLGFVWLIEDVTVRRRAEQTLNDRIAFQRVLLDTVPVPIFIQDVSGFFIDANTALEDWLGLDRQALFGRMLSDLASEELAQLDEAANRDLLASGRTQTFESRIRCVDGVLRDVVVSKAVFRRNGGKPAGIVGAMVDISERKRAEQALLERHALFEQIFVASGAVKLLIDPDGGLPDSGLIVDANPAAAAFYGHALDALRGLRLADISAPAAPGAAPDTSWAQGGTGEEGGRTLHCRHRLASGEIRDVEVYVSPVQVNGRRLLLSLIHDITERRLAEEGLRLKTVELERSNAELEAFAYVASHDLRQPLRVINSYLALLERSLDGQLDEETTEFIGFARDGAQRMDRLIVDLLEYSRVGRKAKAFRPVPLGDLVDTALLNLQVAVAEASATVTVNGPLPTVDGDENELIRLFQNLIGNAVRYRTPDRAPVVTVACARDGDRGHWVFDIRDNGIGIAPEHLERVFGIFQRLHRRDEYEGTGVGLAVCKKIVEHHGGAIWVESVEGEGSAFRFTLPVRPVSVVHGGMP